MNTPVLLLSQFVFIVTIIATVISFICMITFSIGDRSLTIFRICHYYYIFSFSLLGCFFNYQFHCQDHWSHEDAWNSYSTRVWLGHIDFVREQSVNHYQWNSCPNLSLTFFDHCQKSLLWPQSTPRNTPPEVLETRNGGIARTEIGS